VTSPFRPAIQITVCYEPETQILTTKLLIMDHAYNNTHDKIPVFRQPLRITPSTSLHLILGQTDITSK